VSDLKWAMEEANFSGVGKGSGQTGYGGWSGIAAKKKGGGEGRVETKSEDGSSPLGKRIGSNVNRGKAGR